MAEYIERGTLIEEARHNGPICQCMADFLDVKRLIEDAPAADVVPIVHGFWKVNGINPHNGTVGNYRCSVCDKVSLEDSSYCPNCGAKMDIE